MEETVDEKPIISDLQNSTNVQYQQMLQNNQIVPMPQMAMANQYATFAGSNTIPAQSNGK